jgi:hypothetical protein
MESLVLQADHGFAKPAAIDGSGIRHDLLQDFLLALSGRDASKLARHHIRDAGWHAAIEKMDADFDHFQRTFGLPFKAWATGAFGNKSDIKTLFYPFGGADFCFPYFLQPNARDYILVGREPCSLWPLDGPLTRFSFEEIGEALRHYLQFSYFITTDLQRSLESKAVRGVLPLILTQMARCNLPIRSVRPIGIGSEGFCIEFGDVSAPQRLHYYRQDMRDSHWPLSGNLHRHLMASSDLAVFVKSASYLLHEPPFEMLRQIIRDRALLLVQDPSGIPYDLLQNWHWSTGLHGRFTCDIPVFSRYDQSSLAQAYQTAREETLLQFGIGYLTDATRSSLVVASPTKNNAPPHMEIACAS